MSANIIDVLESALGDLSSARLQTLSEDELESVANAVNDHYVGWTAPATDDGFRLYSGGWIAGNTEHPAARAYLYTWLLYAPAVVIHDPVADWFDPKRDFVKSLPPIPRGRTSAPGDTQSAPHETRLGNEAIGLIDEALRALRENVAQVRR